MNNLNATRPRSVARCGWTQRNLFRCKDSGEKNYFLDGFSAVCWTDFFHGLLMLGALLIAPIFALGLVNAGATDAAAALPEGYFNPITSWQEIVSGLGWGLGYFGMPHIIIRFMSLRSEKELKKSSVIGISWTTIILVMSVLSGIVGRL